ncbi:MAG: insulinase family protein [Bacteroidales bacterium]|nr:insulinase family protein [Bacteroidales bacterium]
MTHSFKKKMVAASFILSSMFVASAQQMPPIPTDPAVRIGKLENGLTYYIRHNELPEKRADFYIAQKVGSILEDDHQRGLAHFLEHMCFNGTENFPGKTLIKYLESIGVKFGENLNAYTSIDETVYNICNVPVIRDGVADSCLLILHDWADGLTLAPEEIDSERGVIHEEWRTSSNAMMRMYEKVLPIIYPDNKYAYRLPIGIMEVVDNFPYQALRDYYEKWYRPDQQGIVVVGDVDVDRIEAKIKELFSPIRMPENPAEREYLGVADNQEPIVAIASDKEQTMPMAYVMYKHDAIPNEQKGTLDYLLLNYLKDMASNMLNSRLYELTQTAEPPFIGAQAGDGEFMLSKTKDAFTGYVRSKEDGMETALTALVREIERARKFGFTASEYARAKADYLRTLESAYNERDKVKNDAYVDEYVRHFIDNEPIPGIENEYAIMNQIVPNIPVEAVNSVIKELVNDTCNLVVCVFFPEKEGLAVPTREQVLEAIDKVKHEEITAYEDKVSDEPLMSETPRPGQIVKTEEGPFGSTVLTLSNGARVILKQTDFKADEIRMRAFSPGGSSLFPNEEIINISVMNSVAGLGGLGNFSNVDLEKVLAGKKASINASVGGTNEGLSGSCSPKDLETMMQLAYLSFTAPRMDEDAFTSYKTRLKASLANQEVNPMSALQDTLTQALYMGHPRAIRLKADMVDRIDYAKIMDMYRDRFKDASDFTFIFVGNIDMEEAKPLIETYIASLPSINRQETFKDNQMDMRKGEYKNIFSKQLETPKATVLVINNGTCAYTLKNQVMMSMLSQILNIMYTESVREKEGGTYGVSAYGNLSKYPKEEAVLQIYFDTDPAKREKMTGIILSELEQFATEGPSAENLAKVKEFMLKKHAENAKENSYWVNMLDEYFWEDIDLNTGYEDVVNSITAEDLEAFTKALLDQRNRIEVSMTSEETK